METVNEGTTAYLTATFTDKNGATAVPSSATWEAKDLKSGTVLKASTALVAAAAIEITIPPSVNAMVDSDMVEEIRRVTVRATYGVDDAVAAQYDYRLINLDAVV